MYTQQNHSHCTCWMLAIKFHLPEGKSPAVLAFETLYCLIFGCPICKLTCQWIWDFFLVWFFYFLALFLCHAEKCCSDTVDITFLTQKHTVIDWLFDLKDFKPVIYNFMMAGIRSLQVAATATSLTTSPPFLYFGYVTFTYVVPSFVFFLSLLTFSLKCKLASTCL